MAALIARERPFGVGQRHPGNPRTNKKKREREFAPKRDLAEDVAALHHPAQNECRIPIRTSACVCVVDGVKL